MSQLIGFNVEMLFGFGAESCTVDVFEGIEFQVMLDIFVIYFNLIFLTLIKFLEVALLTRAP